MSRTETIAKARAVRAAYEQIFARSRRKHDDLVRANALTRIVGILADSRKPRGANLDYRPRVPINGRTGMPLLRGSLF